MFRTYAYKVIPFGMTNEPSHFQRVLDPMLRDKINTNMFVYLDNILVATGRREDHGHILEWVLDRLTKFGWRGKFEKCEFCRQKNYTYAMSCQVMG
jgi:Reverse transcriptase (RNA-dependent DNA polymerase)